MNIDDYISQSNSLSAPTVAHALGLTKARERHKWSCPACGSSDGLHVYEGEGRGAFCWACDKGFDAIDLVRAATQLAFKEAVAWLAHEFSFSHNPIPVSPSERVRIDRERAEKQRAEDEQRERDTVTAREVYNTLWESMRLGPVGREYLESRCIPYEVADHVGIRSVETRSEWESIRSACEPGDLATAGLVGTNKKGEEYPVPWSTPFLVLPYWLDVGLDVLRFRSLKYLGSKGLRYVSPMGRQPSVPFLSWSAGRVAVENKSTLYICEGEFDSLSIVLAGHPAIGIPGSGAWRDEWCEYLRDVDSVVIIGDGDEGGLRLIEKVATSIKKTLGEKWLTSGRLKQQLFARGTDANEALILGRLNDFLSKR